MRASKSNIPGLWVTKVVSTVYLYLLSSTC